MEKTKSSNRGLIDVLRDPAKRAGYAARFGNRRISRMIQLNRESREWSQQKLGQMAGMEQAQISRLENEGYGSWTIRVLRKIAASMDCWLDVRLQPFSRLVELGDAIGDEDLTCPTFAQDSLFRLTQTELAVRRELMEWLRDPGWRPEKLLDWLAGAGLPVGRSLDPPYRWLLRVLIDKDEKRRLAGRLEVVLLRLRPDVEPKSVGGQEVVKNLYWLAAGLECPEFLWIPLKDALGRTDSELDNQTRAALAVAIVPNQADETMLRTWENMIEKGSDPALPGDEAIGLNGLAHLPNGPDWARVARAFKRLELRLLPTGVSNAQYYLACTERLKGLIDLTEAPQELLTHARRSGWSEYTTMACAKATEGQGLRRDQNATHSHVIPTRYQLNVTGMGLLRYRQLVKTARASSGAR